MGFVSRSWFPYLTAFIGFALLGLATTGLPVISNTALGFSAIAAIGAAVHLYRDRRDPYDLGELQRVHEREELDAIDVPSADVSTVLCLQCNAEYSGRYPTCPRCAKLKRIR